MRFEDHCKDIEHQLSYLRKSIEENDAKFRVSQAALVDQFHSSTSKSISLWKDELSEFKKFFNVEMDGLKEKINENDASHAKSMQSIVDQIKARVEQVEKQNNSIDSEIQSKRKSQQASVDHLNEFVL